MAQCVMTIGTTKMPLWSADNWDSLLMVKLSSFEDIMSSGHYMIIGALSVEDGTLFHDSSRNVVLRSVNCTGKESKLLECDSELPVMYQETNLASVVCQGNSDRDN